MDGVVEAMDGVVGVMVGAEVMDGVVDTITAVVEVAGGMEKVDGVAVVDGKAVGRNKNIKLFGT